MQIVIRKFAEGEAAQLAEVFYQAVHQTAAADYSPQQLATWAPAIRDAQQWAEKIDRIQPFVAEIGGIIVGYADVQPDGYIDHFFVSPRAGRQGVGAALMRQIHEAAIASHTPRLYSNVSLTARPFFEKFGFIIDDPQVVMLRGIAFNNFRMSKVLADRPEF